MIPRCTKKRRFEPSDVPLSRDSYTAEGGLSLAVHLVYDGKSRWVRALRRNFPRCARDVVCRREKGYDLTLHLYFFCLSLDPGRFFRVYALHTRERSLDVCSVTCWCVAGLLRSPLLCHMWPSGSPHPLARTGRMMRDCLDRLI